MRTVIIIIAVALVAWIGWDLLVSGPEQRPSPSRQTTESTSADAAADRIAYEAARKDGRVREDPARKRLRRDVMHAAERLEQAPCNATAQATFAETAIAFLRKKLQEPSAPTIEAIRVDGRDVDVTKYFDEDSLLAIAMAVRQGQLRVEDLPADLDPLKPIIAQGRIGKPICDS